MNRRNFLSKSVLGAVGFFSGLVAAKTASAVGGGKLPPRIRGKEVDAVIVDDLDGPAITRWLRANVEIGPASREMAEFESSMKEAFRDCLK